MTGCSLFTLFLKRSGHLGWSVTCENSRPSSLPARVAFRRLGGVSIQVSSRISSKSGYRSFTYSAAKNNLSATTKNSIISYQLLVRRVYIKWLIMYYNLFVIGVSILICAIFNLDRDWVFGIRVVYLESKASKIFFPRVFCWLFILDWLQT